MTIRSTRGPANNDELSQKVVALQAAVSEQQTLFQTFQTCSTGNIGSASTGSSVLQLFKSRPILVYAEKAEDCTRTKINGFICNVRRVGRLSNNNDESKLVQLAECHLQDRASTWINRFEERSDKPQPLQQLQNAMMRQFVPSNEEAKAQPNLLPFTLRVTLDKHVNDFIEPMEICETPKREARAFLFMSASQYLKGELTKGVPRIRPPRYAHCV